MPSTYISYFGVSGLLAIGSVIDTNILFYGIVDFSIHSIFNPPYLEFCFELSVFFKPNLTHVPPYYRANQSDMPLSFWKD